MSHSHKLFKAVLASSLFALGSGIAMADSNSGPNLPYYVQFGLSHLSKGSGDNNTITIYQRPTADPITLQADDQSPDYQLGYSLGGGYIMPMTGNWSWSIGGEFSMGKNKQKGRAQLEDLSPYNYNYSVKYNTLAAVGRIYYTFGDWQAIGGLNLGFAQLKSEGYTSDTAGDVYANKSKTNLYWELDGGMSYHFMPEMSVSALLGYQHLGEASLGAKVPGEFGSNSGTIKQKLNAIKLSILLSYYF